MPKLKMIGWENLKASKWLKILFVLLIGIPFQTFIPILGNNVKAETQTDPAPFILHKGSELKGKVLFDNTHGETAGAADWVIDGGFSDFANAIADNGYDVQELRKTTPITYDDLKNYNVFVLGESNVPFKATEQQAMLDYVKNGGSIFFIADHYNSDRNKNRWDAGEIFNGYRRGAWDNPTKGMSAEEAASSAMQGVTSSDWLADNFGVRFRYNALGDITSGETVVSPEQSFGITKGVTTVEMHAGSTIAIMDPTIAKGLIYLPENPPAWANAVDDGVYDNGGIAEGAFAAISKVGKGKAAFIGDSSPVEDSTPKYLREDNGQKKSTFDGFLTEGQDATYLTNVVLWLAKQEDYTKFNEIPNLELSEKTKLHDYEIPENSTEPQPEPWAAPDPGYKWYDSSTFKPGSFGSTQQAAINPTYKLVYQDKLPNNGKEFNIRVVVDNLLPNSTLSGLSVGLYLAGGTQVGQFEGATTPGYSSNFSVTADATGHATKDLKVIVKNSAAVEASLRLKQGSNNVLTKTVALGDVDPVDLPKDIIPVPDKVSIAAARNAKDGDLVTVEGVVTTKPGAWGDAGFYLQDDSAGVYVFQKDPNYSIGDKIKISAIKTTYSGEVELSDIVSIEDEGKATVPTPSVQSTVSADNQGQLISLENVTVSNVGQPDKNGNFEFDVFKGEQGTHVRIDSRTGIGYSNWIAKYPEGTQVNITGISSIFKDAFQLKPRSMDDFSEVVPGNGGSTDPGNGGSTDPGNGGSTDPGNGGNTDPGNGGSTDPDGTTIITVDDEQVSQVKENSSLDIKIDNPKGNKTIEVNLTKNQVSELINKHANIVVENDDLELKLPMDNVKAEQLKLTITKRTDLVDQEILGNTYDFTLTNNGEVISHFDSPVTLTFSVDPTKVTDPSKVSVYYYNENNEWEIIDSSYSNGNITAMTNHFSTYAVRLLDTKSTDPGNGGSTDPGNGGSTNPGNGGSTNPGNGGSTNPGNGGSTDPGNGGSTNPGNGGNTNPANGGNTSTVKGGSDSSSNGGEKVSPSHGGKTASNNQLPNTATNNYNMLLFGFILAISGISLLVVSWRKKKSINA